MGNRNNTTQIGLFKDIQTYRKNKNNDELQQLINQFKIQSAKCCPPEPIIINSRKNKQKALIYYKDLCVYYGFVKESKADGDGIMFYQNKTFYQGKFANGCPSGNGKLINGIDHHIIKQGEWVNSKFAKGQIFLPKSSYCKKFQIKQNEQYSITYENNQIYQGNGYIKNNQFYKHGVGKLSDPKTNYQYQGNWKDNKREGDCTVKFQNSTFKGVYSQDKKLSGKLTTKDKIQLEGKWSKDNKFTGSAKDLNSNSIKQYKNNIKQ